MINIQPSLRNESIDGLRGLLLVIMATNHIESALLTPFTRQPFGFVSAFESFILLSGIVAAMAYGRYVGQPAELKRRVWKRVAILYTATLVGVFTVTALLHLRWFDQLWYYDWGNYFLLENYLQYPFEALTMSVLQIHQMGYLDILVAYMVPMLFLPWALILLKQDKWWVVAGISVAVWLMAQVLTDAALIPIYHWFQPDMKMDAGYLDVFAWQLLFYTGVIIGYQYKFNQLKLTDNRSVTVVVLVLALLYFVAYRFDLASQVENSFIQAQLSWQDVGLIRYTNTLLLAYLVSKLIQSRFPLFSFKPLVFLGQHSLQVFIYHAVAIYFFLPWMYKQNESYIWWGDLLLTALFIASLYIPAGLHHVYRQHNASRSQLSTN